MVRPGDMGLSRAGGGEAGLQRAEVNWLRSDGAFDG